MKKVFFTLLICLTLCTFSCMKMKQCHCTETVVTTYPDGIIESETSERTIETDNCSLANGRARSSNTVQHLDNQGNPYYVELIVEINTVCQ
ncbi:MAG: hypothetical protein LBR51_02965 [Bacteroidales bacterium]|jgi:hypothetical protein|nr:hypothetical protein [Bacteroidales bacterium]